MDTLIAKINENLPALESSVKFLLEDLRKRKCDDESVQLCIRCNAMYLALRMQELLNIAKGQ